jgi:cytochrome P450/NADPH-cytochrome P450 reductase
MDQAQDSADGTSGLLPIPQVPTHLFGLVGNLPDVDSSFFARSIWRLADLYGPIFQLDLLARKTIVISSYELLKEVMDDDRFEKFLGNGLVEVRAIVKDGLFTAYGDEPVSLSRTILAAY